MASKDDNEKVDSDEKFYMHGECSNEWQRSIIKMDPSTNLNEPADPHTDLESLSTNDYQELILPPLLGLPFPLPVPNIKINSANDLHCNESNSLPTNTLLICSPNVGCTNKSVLRGASSSDFPCISSSNSIPSSVALPEALPAECLSNVEDWFKQRSDSLSSLEFDSDMKQSDYDFHEFLNLKYTSQSTMNSSTDIQPKVINGYLNTHSAFSDSESLSSNCTESSRGKATNSGLCLEKGPFEDLLVSDLLKKSKSKDVSGGIDDKGLFEALLLPNVHDWLLAVSSLDKKDGTSITVSENDPFSVPQSNIGESNLNAVSNMLSMNKCSSDEYITATEKSDNGINSLKIAAIDFDKNLQFDEAHQRISDIENESVKQLNKLPVESVTDVNNKLFTLLDFDEAPVSGDNHVEASKVYSHPLIQDTPGIFVKPKINENIKNTSLSTCTISLNATSPSNMCSNSYSHEKKLQSSRTMSSKSSTARVFQVKALNLKKFTTISNIRNTTTIKVKKANRSIPKLIIPQLLSPSSSKEMFSINKSQDNQAKVILLPLHNNVIIESPTKVFLTTSGIAKVQISVNCTDNTTTVLVISSNNENTVFKINTSDLIKAISSIKEEQLEPLGLKNFQLMETAIAAHKLLSNSYNSSKSHPNAPQYFEIKQQIQEIKAPAVRPKTIISSPHSMKQVQDRYTNDNDTSKEIIVKISPKVCDDVTQFNSNNVDNKRDSIERKTPTEKIKTAGENVGISLLPGAPPTMVSVPSVLDSLSGPTSSNICFANLLGKHKRPKSVKKEVQDEKINTALLQLGFDPYSLTPDKDCDKGNRWTCPIVSCSKRSLKLSYLKVHILSHKGIRPYKCSYEKCDWSFYTSYKLKRHLETHLNRRDFKCTETDCNRRFTTIYNLNTHMSLHKRPKTWICINESCGMAFHTRRRLEGHMKLHSDATPPYKCSREGCSKAYFTPNSLASHARVHHKDQDLVCQWLGCGKKFDKPCRLSTHMRSHTGQRPFACTFKGCNWRFNCASKLSRHQRKHTNDRKFSCPICKKAFLRSDHLKEHLLTHTGVRNFQCSMDNCDAKFTAKSSLYVHLKKHKFSKISSKLCCPFENCDIPFDSKYSQRQHLLKVHSASPGECDTSFVPLLSSAANSGEIAVEGMLSFAEVDLGFPDPPKSKSVSFPGGSSARTNVIGNYLLSKKAKKRQRRRLSHKMLAVASEVSKLRFCNELSLTDGQSPTFQPGLMPDDSLSTTLYSDSLSDSTSDPQSTINLRDLE